MLQQSIFSSNRDRPSHALKVKAQQNVEFTKLYIRPLQSLTSDIRIEY